jgi:hypothetical protein
VPSIDVAYLREEPHDLIFVLLHSSYLDMSESEKEREIEEIEYRVFEFGLRGIIITVWLEKEKMCFIANVRFHDYTSSYLTYELILMNVNNHITW